MALVKAARPDHSLDVLIVADPVIADPLGRAMETALVARGLRARLATLEDVSTERVARLARFSLALAADGAVLRYALIPAPPYLGAEPRFAEGVGSIDVGAVALNGSSAELVERIVQRVRPGR